MDSGPIFSSKFGFKKRILAKNGELYAGIKNIVVNCIKMMKNSKKNTRYSRNLKKCDEI